MILWMLLAPRSMNMKDGVEALKGTWVHDRLLYGIPIENVLWYVRDRCLPSASSDDAVLAFKTTHVECLVWLLCWYRCSKGAVMGSMDIERKAKFCGSCRNMTNIY
jgi:hypothetical protein